LNVCLTVEDAAATAKNLEKVEWSGGVFSTRHKHSKGRRNGRSLRQTEKGLLLLRSFVLVNGEKRSNGAWLLCRRKIKGLSQELCSVSNAASRLRRHQNAWWSSSA
jgi:hypothetical protein